MNLEQLIAQFRVDADDLVQPYLWPDDWVAPWLTEAVSEAAVRGRLIYEAANAAVSQIAVSASAATHELHKSLFELVHLRFQATGATTSSVVTIKSREELDRIRPGWRDETGTPRYAVQDDTRITLVPRPEVAGTLHVEGYRVPLKPLANDTDKPEIHEAHHRHLVQWALHRAFSIPDTEAFDAARADRAEAAFTRYFGIAPDSDMRRQTREDVLHVNQAFSL